MSAGLFGLFDDVAAIARAAAASVDDVAAAAGKASVNAAGVVIDDTAVTPQYLNGVGPERELPIVGRIALGSVRNKLLIILPVLLILSEFASWALAPILFLGGGFLAFEGAEKVVEALQGEHPEHAESAGSEEALIRSAIRTDLVLSTEIMMISSASLGVHTLWSRAAVLIVVALVVTAAVYGVVGLIVKMDDVGLHLLGRTSAASRYLGRGLVMGMPKLLSALSTIGVLAMLWVGGHILLTQLAEMGWHEPEHVVVGWGHHLGGVGGWALETVVAGAVGLAVGLLLALSLAGCRRRRGR